MTWSTSEIEYEGFPLLLRKPDYNNIWQYKEHLTQLITIEHLLDKVSPNGLPEKNYNKSLASFDEYMCALIDKDTNGIIFLIETFAGKRNYYYYTLPHHDISKLIEKAKIYFKVKLTTTVKEDNGWGFFKEYPVELFKP
jgi:Family of unknown function (DUF695)